MSTRSYPPSVSYTFDVPTVDARSGLASEVQQDLQQGRLSNKQKQAVAALLGQRGIATDSVSGARRVIGYPLKQYSHLTPSTVLQVTTQSSQVNLTVQRPPLVFGSSASSP